MAKQELTAPYKLVYKYTVSLLQHKTTMFCDVVPATAFADNLITCRPGKTGMEAGGALDAYFTMLAPFFMPSISSFDGGELWVRSGTEWIFVNAGTTTVVGSAESGPDLAMGGCIMGKDALNRRMSTYVFEGIVGLTQKLTNYSTMANSYKALAAGFFNANGAAGGHDPYWYRTSADGEFAQRWLSIVVDSNEKLRRIRHIK